MPCDILSNSYSAAFSLEFAALQNRIYEIKHLLPYNRDHVEYLTHITKQYNKDLELFFSENVFTCARCGSTSILHKICNEPPPPGRDFLECIRHDNSTIDESAGPDKAGTVKGGS